MSFIAWDSRSAMSSHASRRLTRISSPPRPRHDNPNLVYLAAYKVLVCEEHATGVQNLATHLREHHTLSLQQRRHLLDRFDSLERCQPADITLPPHGQPPLSVLGSPLDAFRCTADGCDFVTVSMPLLQRHGKNTHDASWTGDTSDRFDTVCAQTFFRSGGLQRYFVVRVPPRPGCATAVPAEAQRAIDQRLAQWTTTQQHHEAESQVMEAQAAKTDRTGWFRRTGWLEHLANRNLDHLSHQLRLPDANEPKLKLAVQLTEELVARSVRGLHTLGRETRRWLRSAKQSEADPRPLGPLQNPESQARYTGYMARLVCYALRIVADEEQRAAAQRRRRPIVESDDGDDDDQSTDSSRSGDSASDSSDAGDGESSRRPRRRQPTDMMKDARELFPWEAAQRAAAADLWGLLDRRDARDEQLEGLLDFIASFIFQRTGDRPFRGGLVHFMAVLGIDRATRRMRTAKHYSYMLAGIVYCVRVLAAEFMCRAAAREHMTDAQMDERTELMMALRREYLADGSYSPMSESLSLLAYGKSVALATGNEGSASWSADKTIFYLHGRPIHLHRFRTMAQDLIAETEAMLWDELAWAPSAADRPTLSLSALVDDVTCARRGASFVTHAANDLDGGLAWMLTQVARRPEARSLQHPNGDWRIRGVKRYLRTVDRFLEMLLACVHITSGQPGRGSEVLTMRHRNGLLQDRNILLQDKHVMTVVRYHKSQSQWDKPKIVPRFLPPRLGHVMAVYLAYLQPFREYLVVEVLGGGFSDYVWAGSQGPWETERLTRVLRRETGKRLGVELHTLGYRHTAVGLGRVVVSPVFAQGYQDGEGEAEELEAAEAEEEDILELQNARTTLMGTGNYGVRADIVQHLTSRSIEAFRNLSFAWHRWLGVGPQSTTQRLALRTACLDAPSAPKRGVECERSVLEDDGLRPAKLSRADDAQQLHGRVQEGLRQVLGQQSVGFRSLAQEQAMYAVLAGSTPLVVVLPTGGGKSLLFMVPAVLERGAVTVVVVPYRALINSMLERIQQRGIDCCEWTHSERRAASIVLVSADVAGDATSAGNFIGFATMLSSQGRLRRIVVDEAHLAITASHWREKLALLRNLRILSCQMVLLTATLPPVREPDLAEAMLVPTATYIRASTVRPNTSYSVMWCQAQTAQQSAIDLCRRNTPRLIARRERGIVYACSRAQCEAIAAELGCPYYHAEHPDRAAHLDEWLQRSGWIVATSSLGTGVDFPGVVFIVHVGMPWSIIDYAQETGRGGRAGERVRAVVVVDRAQVNRTLAQKKGDVDVVAMGNVLLTESCRRGALSSYLDGRHIGCLDAESARCDQCGDGAGEVLAQQKEWSEEWEIVRRLYDDLRENCVACALLNPEPGGWMGHKAMHCPGVSGLTVARIDRFRTMLQDGGGTHTCRRCWVSQKFCATGQDVAHACQWPNVVVPLARAAAEEPAGRQLIQTLGYTGSVAPIVEQEYARWLGKRVRSRVWGEFFSNAMVLSIVMLVRLYRALNPT